MKAKNSYIAPEMRIHNLKLQVCMQDTSEIKVSNDKDPNDPQDIESGAKAYSLSFDDDED